MAEIIIRHVDPALRKALKAKANDEDKSLNSLILEKLEQAVPGWNKDEKKEVQA